jgi:hypothetical protein
MKKWANDMSRDFSKEEVRMAQKYISKPH